MFYNDPSQQKQPSPPPSYVPYRSAPTANQGQPVPVTDKVENIPTPYGLYNTTWQQPGSWYQPVPPPKPPRSRARGAAIFALTCLLAVVFGVGLFAGWTFARTNTGATSNTPVSVSPSSQSSSTASSGNTLTSIEAAQEAAIAKVEPAVVQVEGVTFQGEILGSGVIIDKNGDIVTNNHVVSNASALDVLLSSGNRETAQLVGADPANDLAIVHIQPFSGMVVASLGDSSQLVVGQEVLAIGNPLGYTQTATAGVVSALNRSADESATVHLTGLIQTSAAINPGNSGGALIDLQGQVMGIPTLAPEDNETRIPAQGIGFAIPSNQVQAAIKQILG